MGDKLGEAKSSGNLGNALKVMGKFDEAVVCCTRHLEISRELKDKVCIIKKFRSVEMEKLGRMINFIILAQRRSSSLQSRKCLSR